MALTATPRVGTFKGLKQDDGRHPRENFRTLRNRLGSEPSGAADLSGFAPPIYDQNEVGSCVENGVPCAIYTTLAANDMALGFYPSVQMGYQLDLRLDRAHD